MTNSEPMKTWPFGDYECVQYYNAGAQQWVAIYRDGRGLVQIPEKLPGVPVVEMKTT
jgi:hypothetical protein